MPSPRILTPMLIVEDGSHRFWRIWPDGSVQYVEEFEHDKVAALKPHPSLRVEHLQNREPYEIYRFAVCPECQGKGYVETLCVYERQGPDRAEENEYWSCVGRFDGAVLDDIGPLGKGRYVGMGEWDCDQGDDECHSGIVLQATGDYVWRHELVHRVAA